MGKAPLLAEEVLRRLEGGAAQPAKALRPQTPSAKKAARLIAQLRSIQNRTASTPFTIAVVGSQTTTVLHEQIIELLSYALVLGGNRVVTAASSGANSAVIKGALRADERLLTVVVPSTAAAVAEPVRSLLDRVRDVVELRHGNLPEELYARLVHSEIIGSCDRLVVFAFHRSSSWLQMAEEAAACNVDTCVLYLD